MFLDLDDIAVGILDVDRKPHAAGASARQRLVLEHGNSSVPQRLHDFLERAFGGDAEVEESAVAGGFSVVGRIRDEVQELIADTQRDEGAPPLIEFFEALDAETEEIAIESERCPQIPDAQHEVVEAPKPDHGAFLARFGQARPV